MICLAAGLMTLHGIEVGLIAGHSGADSAFFYGLSAGSGIFIPMTRLEFEGHKFSGNEWDELSAGVAFRPRFGRIAPYMIVGAGTGFEKFNFHFSEYKAFSFLGGGCHLFLARIFSLRFDVRFLHFRDVNTTRLSGGIFLHI